ncbi:NUDIX hydrolase [Frankia sp. CcWB3]
MTGDRVLLANERGQKSFHLPGGWVEPGETVQTALRRLLNEQAGIELDYLTFVGGIQNISIERGERMGVLDVVFAADRSWGADFGSRLNDLDIVSVSLGSLLDLELRPADLRRRPRLAHQHPSGLVRVGQPLTVGAHPRIRTVDLISTSGSSARTPACPHARGSECGRMKEPGDPRHSPVTGPIR